MTSTFEKKPNYRSKIKQTPLNEAPPKQAMPEKSANVDWDVKDQSASLLWVITLGIGILSFLSFSIFHAVDTIVSYFDTYPIFTTVLTLGLTSFILMISLLTYREIKGYLGVEHFMKEKIDLENLLEQGDKNSTLSILKKHSLRLSKSSFAKYCYRQFETSINSDLSNQEVLNLYQQIVTDPVLKKAEEVLKKESFLSGGLAFISPNNLIQTLLLLWVSMRTIKRIASVFGLRAGVIGNWKLIKIVVENMAAQSFFDLATDEITNQISSSLAAKFMENSAEAFTAGALNIRLGKSLINQLSEKNKPVKTSH